MNTDTRGNKKGQKEEKMVASYEMIEKFMIRFMTRFSNYFQLPLERIWDFVE